MTNMLTLKIKPNKYLLTRMRQNIGKTKTKNQVKSKEKCTSVLETIKIRNTTE